jgi:hypothetical protein
LFYAIDNLLGLHLFDQGIVTTGTTGTVVIPITRRFVRQLGTNEKDEGKDLCSNSKDELFVVGVTDGNLAGSNAGSSDAFIVKYDGDGKTIWSHQFGTGDFDSANGTFKFLHYNSVMI